MAGPFESVSPLPADVRASLLAMLVTGTLSLLSTASLLVHITVILVRWKVRDIQHRKHHQPQHEPHQKYHQYGGGGGEPTGASHPDGQTPIDLSLGLSEAHYYQTRLAKKNAAAAITTTTTTTTTAPSAAKNEAAAAAAEIETPATDIAALDSYTTSNSVPQPQKRERTNTTASGVRSATTHHHRHQPSSAVSAAPPPPPRRLPRRQGDKPNPLLLLIYNLLGADTLLSATYLHNIYWLKIDGIIAPSGTCSSQGWFVSFGCLTTSGFLFIISVFSYLGIIRGYKATTRDVLVACACIWSSSIVLASLGPMYYREPSFWGRETNWCWVSQEHHIWRLTVYVWGFGTMSATCALYSYVFYTLRQQKRSSRLMPWSKDPLQHSHSDDVPDPDPDLDLEHDNGNDNGNDHDNHNDHDHENDNNTLYQPRRTSSTSTSSTSTRLHPSGHHPAFLVYPCIYAVTGTPLILGSLIPALETNVPFMGVCGALLGVTGFMDALLWSSIILFSKKERLVEIGLDKFAFMRTPEGRTLGNIVIVQGGRSSSPGASGGDHDAFHHHHHHNNINAGGSNNGNGHNRHHRQSWHSKKDHGWWRLRDRNSSQRSFTTEQGPHHSRHGNGGGSSGGGGGGIQMQIVTSVVVEDPRLPSLTHSQTWRPRKSSESQM